jgi:uncharacterized tellurite resistance protein B-like protein
MTFSTKEMAAIVRIAKQMCNADGRFSQSEVDNLISFTENFNIKEVEELADDMTGYEAAAILAHMSADQKYYACCYFAELMAVDGVISDAEVKVWQFVSQLADFPNMTIREALNSNYRKL